jgi:hypothetical protein
MGAPIKANAAPINIADIKSPHFRSSIISLFFCSRPSAIFLTVMPVIINPINRSILSSKFFAMLKIRFVHIMFKFFKSFPKTFNTSATPSFVTSGILIITTCFDMFKDNIKSVRRHTMSSRSISSRFLYFLKITTTACSLITNYARSISNGFFSTVTSKQPFITESLIWSFLTFNKFNSNKSIKSLSCNIFSMTKNVSLFPFIPRNGTFGYSII